MEKRHSQWIIKLIPTSSQHNPSLKSKAMWNGTKLRGTGQSCGNRCSWHQFFIFRTLLFVVCWALGNTGQLLKNLTAAALQSKIA
jgi:hypothetical protein